jgi:REP element-mobilizing transposase RayT
MTLARAHLVDVSVTRWYHCVTRCVRRAFLLNDGEFDRRQWIENRTQELSGIFAISVGGFSVMDNHLHLLVRLDE